MMRKLFDDWHADNADELQTQISGLRTALQGYPLIPVMEAIMAHYCSYKAWAALRPPNMALDQTTARCAVKQLADEHGFSLDLTTAV